MNEAQQLYNAARHYCMQRHADWCLEYQKLQERGEGRTGFGYSDRAYDTFPRYQVLDAILTDIERMDPDELPPASALKELLVLAGHTAESVFTKNPGGEIEAAAMAQERAEFERAVHRITPDELARLSLLSYRRVLSPREVDALWARAKQRWGADGHYFYPLAEATVPGLKAFDSTAFDEQFPSATLREILQSRGVTRLYELREYGDGNYSLDVDLWEPGYNGAEGFWFSEALDWILYCSHEGSSTVGGVLAEVVLARWPEAGNHHWQLMAG